MRKSSIVLAFIALVSLAGSTVLGQVVEGIVVGPDVPSPSGGPYLASGGNLINFDDVEAPCFFQDTVALTNEYAAQGVIFSGPGGNNGGARLDECGSFGVSGHSSPNFLAFNTAAPMADGGIPAGPETITFSPLAASVTINGGLGGTITMECFDASAVSVGSDVIVGTSVLAPLTVSAPGIESCVLSFTDSVAVFDDLQWEDDGGGDGGGVPASSPLGVLVLLAILMTVSWAILRPKDRTRHRM